MNYSWTVNAVLHNIGHSFHQNKVAKAQPDDLFLGTLVQVRVETSHVSMKGTRKTDCILFLVQTKIHRNLDPNATRENYITCIDRELHAAGMLLPLLQLKEKTMTIKS